MKTNNHSGEPPADDYPIRVGISSCLMGAKVRYNGGHKQDLNVKDSLSHYFEWVRVCPEVEIGMGTPREAVRLQGVPENPRMVGVNSGRDWTELMNLYSRQKSELLKQMNLHGYILKSKSPSCGLYRVKVYTEEGSSSTPDKGLFARALTAAMPNLPIEEEGRLNDAHLRENFIVNVFCYFRWTLMRQGFTELNQLIDFHTRHKFLLMAHSEQDARALGRLIANAQTTPAITLLTNYENQFFAGMKKEATVKRHTNVLQHIAGFFKKKITAGDKKELHDTIEDYRLGLLPLIVPITLIRHHLRTTGQEYIADQVYLNPHPKELMLLNHV